jgi:hypothetical protein
MLVGAASVAVVAVAQRARGGAEQLADGVAGGVPASSTIPRQLVAA